MKIKVTFYNQEVTCTETRIYSKKTMKVNATLSFDNIEYNTIIRDDIKFSQSRLVSKSRV